MCVSLCVCEPVGVCVCVCVCTQKGNTTRCIFIPGVDLGRNETSSLYHDLDLPLGVKLFFRVESGVSDRWVGLPRFGASV